jgi:hypothetical protein
MKVPFTQFIPPHGRQERIEIELADELAPKLEQIAAAGCRLTAEILSTGICSFCIEEPELGDFDITLVVNGPQVPIKITDMIQRFTPELFEQWKALETA